MYQTRIGCCSAPSEGKQVIVKSTEHSLHVESEGGSRLISSLRVLRGPSRGVGWHFRDHHR